MGNILTKYNRVWIYLVLAFTTVAVYWQVCTYDFVNYDDPFYVYLNPNIQSGITLKVVQWAFTTGYAANWHPLTWLSHMLDWQLFGSNAKGHHLTSLIFHIANTLLLFVVLKQMTRKLWQSTFVAALFALHPLHVESVAWVAERKDVLSTFFWLLTMWAYVRFVERPKISSYLLIVVFFALGLMSKPMLVTLPFVLLLLDYWPLNRLGTKHSLFYLFNEKIPLFVMSIASSVVTFIVQKNGGAMGIVGNHSFPVRLANAFVSYLQYVFKMFWPVRLTFFYPHLGQNVSITYAVISAAVLLAVTILVVRFAKNHRYLAVGWFWYLGTLVPVIGIIQVGGQAFADRYTYITLTGLFIIIAWGVPELIEKWPYRKFALWTSSLIVLSVLASLAYFQQRYWKNDLIFFQHALEITKDNYAAHFGISKIYLEQGRYDEVIRHNTEAIRIKPDYVEAFNCLGVALQKEGRIDEAISNYKQALICNKRSIEKNTIIAKIRLNLASALAIKGNYTEAVTHYRIGLMTLNLLEVHRDFGYALVKLGRFEEAAIEYSKVLSVFPDDPNVLNELGYAMENSGRFDEAIFLYNKALQITPDSVNIHLNLGAALIGSGKIEQAVKEYEKILLIQPQNARAHNDIGVIFSQQKKFDEAISHFNQAIRIDPNYTDARNNLNFALEEKQKLQSTEKTKK